MKIHADDRSNRIILHIQGSLTQETAAGLEKAIGDLLESPTECGFKPVVLDMAQVDVLDDTALDILSDMLDRASACIPDTDDAVTLLRITNPSTAVQDALFQAGMLNRFTGWQGKIWRMTPPDHPDDGYPELLERVRRAFPTPVSDPIHDAYLVQSIAKGIDRIDAMKHNRPYLGRRVELEYDKARTADMPEDMATVEETINDLATYLEGLVLWGHPHTQENVIPPSSIPSVVGHVLAAICNPNIIWDEYSHKVGEAEVEASAMCSRLVGYDPATSAGIFTWGGTGTTFYGVKLGIERAQPGAFKNGVQPGLRLLSSDASHYAKLNTLGWLGLGTNSLVTVPTDQDNAMDLTALEAAMRGILDRGETIACILCTMGTTDAFGLDNLEGVADIRDRLTREYGLASPPHIHADAVIGWAWSVFNDYDFQKNPMRFPERTLRSLWDVRERIRHLDLADSMGIDFHKTGYAPYLSSLFLTKDRKDLERISRDKALMPYLFQFGNYHPGVFTMETSRSAGSALAALANLKLFGKNGYRAILGHTVSMAEALRAKLEQAPFSAVVNDYNHGPVTLFRIYPDGVDPSTTLEREMTDPQAADILRQGNDYNRAIFKIMQRKMEEGGCLALSLTDRYRLAPDKTPILALKSYVMSPYTQESSMDQLVHCLAAAREEHAAAWGGCGTAAGPERTT